MAVAVYPRNNSGIWWTRYRSEEGRIRLESTGKRDREDAEKVLRQRLVARDEGTLPHVDLENRLVHLPDSKTESGIADMPMTERAREAFESQMKESNGSEYLSQARERTPRDHISQTVGKV
jgi:hypothetical protein